MAKFKIGERIQDPLMYRATCEVLDVQTISSLGGTVKPHYILVNLYDASIDIFPVMLVDDYFFKTTKNRVTKAILRAEASIMKRAGLKRNE